MTKGILTAKPMINRGMLPLAAAATPSTLSKLMTKSASRIVLIAVIKLSLDDTFSSPSSALSSWIPIQTNSTAPISFK